MAWLGDTAAEVALLFAAFERWCWDDQRIEWLARARARTKRNKRPHQADSCPNGHARTEANAYRRMERNHGRVVEIVRCRLCRLENGRRYEAKRKSRGR